MAIDYSWAAGIVRGFVHDLEDDRNFFKGRAGGRSEDDIAYRRDRLATGIERQLSTVLRIAERADPAIRPDLLVENDEADYEWRYERRFKASCRLLGTVEDADEVEQRLGPSGPALSEVALHPWVLEASRLLWDDGHRREAVSAAATQLELHMRAKLDVVDGSGGSLCDAFGCDPPTMKVPKRLRRPGFTTGTDDFKSAHEGAKFVGKGVFLAIRNISTHRTEQPSEDAAIEMLASLSLLARWVDESDVEQLEET